MSNGADKQKQAALDQQQQQLNQQAAQDRAAAETQNPLDAAQQKQALDYFSFLNDPTHDYTKLPGVAYAGMVDDGVQGAAQERTALGAARFGASAVDPNLQAVLASNAKERAQARRGESLQSAVASYDAKMRGVSSDIAARDQARRLGVAGLTTNAGESALNTYAAFTPRPAWGLTLATSALGSAGSAFQGKL